MAGASVVKSLFGKKPKQYEPRDLAEIDQDIWNRRLLATRKDDQGRLRESLQAEQFGSQNPYYNTQWTGTPGGADRQRITTLNEADQQNLDSRRGVDSRLLAMILGGRQQGG